MPEETPAPVTPAPATPQAAPGGAQPAPSPTVTSPPEAASGAAADAKPEGEAAAPAGETKEQKLARLSAAGRAARRAAAKNRELMAQNQRLQQQALEGRRQGETAQQAIARLQELARKDPMALARELGLDSKRVAQEALRENTPEALAEARVRAAEEQAAAVKRELDAWKQAQEQGRAQQMQQQAHAHFVEVSGDAKAYPNVAKMPAPARLAWAQQLLAEDRQRAQAAGYDMATYAPTNSQLLQHMERLAASQGAPAEPPKAAPAAAPDDKQGTGPTTPQTVSSALTSAKYTLPANFDSLSDRDQKHHLARYLESLGGGKKKRNA